MKAYTKKNKDKLVQLYVKVEERSDGKIIRKKVYLHGQYMLKAHIRSVSAGERTSSDNVQGDNLIEAVVNYRRGLENKQDAYLEYDGKTYAITGVDNLDFRHTEVKLTAREINPPTFDSEEYLRGDQR